MGRAFRGGGEEERGNDGITAVEVNFRDGTFWTGACTSIVMDEEGRELDSSSSSAKSKEVGRDIFASINLDTTLLDDESCDPLLETSNSYSLLASSTTGSKCALIRCGAVDI